MKTQTLYNTIKKGQALALSSIQIEPSPQKKTIAKSR